MKAFIVDMFYSRIQNRDAVSGAGRLENGETFGFVDFRLDPILYIRRSDEARLKDFKLPSPLHYIVVGTSRKTMDGEALVALKAEHLAGLRQLNEFLTEHGLRTYEGDLDFCTRYRIDRGIKLTVEIEGELTPSQLVNRLYINPTLTPVEADIPLKVLALDIETDHDASRILGFSFVSWTVGLTDRVMEEVHLHGEASPDDPDFLRAYPKEKDLLLAFQERLLAIDPDIVTGWNVIDFDLAVVEKLAEKHRITLSLGRSKAKSLYRKSRFFGRSRYLMQGRQVLDALALARQTLFNFDDLRLGTVASALLGRGKTLLVEEWQDAAAVIFEAYTHDRARFAEYVLEDSRLVKAILENQKLIELTTARSQLTSLPLEKAWGSIAAFEALYIAELHKKDFAAPSLGVDMHVEGSGTGGLVLNPKVGLHPHVLIFDFKSLYPSVMRTFNIDPLAYVQGQNLDSTAGAESAITAPNGARFTRQPGILPHLLDEFTKEREEAKAKKDDLGSYTYKIIMNSFYGVLATDACRFADMELADAITGFGQSMLGTMRDYFEARSLDVLYGDTDSLFVRAGQLEGQNPEEAWVFGTQLCREANLFLSDRIRREYGLESKMELEFEKYFRYCFLPPDRLGTGGRAKNYAGLSLKGDQEKIEITGLEAVRSDWTPFARDLQRQLLRMMFQGAAPLAMVTTIRDQLRSMVKGERDDDLIYRKRIRRPLDSYTKTTPPHIRAARLLPRPVRVVRYLVTEQGPQPVGFVTAKILYEHYKEKQVRPIVENIAPYAGFEAEDALELDGGLIFAGTFS